jgi:hypothetical protein
VPARSLHDHLNVQGNKPPQERLQKSNKKIDFNTLRQPLILRPESGMHIRIKLHAKKKKCIALTNVADPDPGSGAFLTPRSGIRE